MMQDEGLDRQVSTGLFWKRLITPALVFLAFLIFFLLLITFVPAAPNSSDIEYYYEIGLKGLREPFVLNRYFHIYLQRIFTYFAQSPLDGLRYFWAFLFSATTALIYILANKTSRRNGFLLGSLALAFFLASQIHIDLAGIPLVDATAMLLSIAIVTLYVFSIDEGRHQSTFLLILGIIAFFGFKSKETTLPITLTLLIFGWRGNSFTIRIWWQKVRLVLVGVLIGMFLFGVLNLIFVKDFLFGLRPSDYLSFLRSYVAEPSVDYIDDTFGNWYYSFWFKFTLLPFIFYLLSGFSSPITHPKPFRILWVIPLAMTAFIILSVNTRYGFNIRFLMPAIPIVCALAPQLFGPFSLLKTKFNLINSLGNFLIPAAFALPIILGILRWANVSNLDLVNTYTILILPVMLTLILVLFFIDHNNRFSQIAILTSLMVALAFPIYRNVKEVVFLRANSVLFEESTQPIAEFLSEIEPSPDMLFCIETTVFSEQPLGIAKNLDEIRGLFDILSGASTKRDNFYVSTLSDDLLQIDNHASRCTYILLPIELQSELESLIYTNSFLQNSYDSLLGQSGDFVLYKHR